MVMGLSIIFIGYGISVTIIRIVNLTLLKIYSYMKNKNGNCIGFIVRFIAYSLLPMVLGVLLIIKLSLEIWWYDAMFFVLALQDNFLIVAFVVLIFALFILIFVFVTKKLATKHGYIDLEGQGFFIVLGIHLIIISFCIGMTIYRIRNINYFINNGINITARIQEIIKKNNKEIYFSYVYELEDKIYSGDARVYKKEEFPFYMIGENVYILVDPANFRNSLFVHISQGTINEWGTSIRAVLADG